MAAKVLCVLTSGDGGYARWGVGDTESEARREAFATFFRSRQGATIRYCDLADPEGGFFSRHGWAGPPVPQGSGVE